MSLYGVPNSGLISSCHSFVACLKGSRPSIFSVPPSPAPGPSGAVPVDTGTAPVPTGLDHAALTSIVLGVAARGAGTLDRKSTRLNSSHLVISYAVFCLKKKKGGYGHHFEIRKNAMHLKVANGVDRF